MINNYVDNCAQMKAYLENPPAPYNAVVPLDLFHCYCGKMPVSDYWQRLGYANADPHNALFDRDGYARRIKVGAILNDTVAVWETTIKQCLGVE